MSDLDPKRIGSLLLPYLALVVIHVLSGLQMQQPLILADELGYLGNARYLSGMAHLPDMRGTGFYHFGYSLFLVPAFWLFSEPVASYKAALVINALLISALYFPLYFILASFSRVPARQARWIAFACCLYPSLLLYSNFAWSESAFVTGFAVAAALFGRYLASRSSRDALLFSLVAAFLYTIHPRALPVVVVALGYLLVLACVRAIPVRQLLLGTSTIATVVFVTRIVNQHLRDMAWSGGSQLPATKLAARLLPDSDFPALVERAAGQLLYLSLASHGLFLVGLLAMIWLVAGELAARPARRVLADPRTGVPVFILISAAGIFVAACTLKLYALHGPYGLRGADFIHGRYNEAFAVLCIAFAAAEYCGRRLGTRQLTWRSLVVVVVILSLATVVMVEVDDALRRQVAGVPDLVPSEAIPPQDVDAVAVPGVFPLVHLFGALDLYQISFAALASFLVLTLVMRLSWRGGLLTLMLLFCFFSYYNYRHYLRPLRSRAEPRLAFATEVRRLGPIAGISFDTAYREPGLRPGIQYLLPDTRFNRFDGAKGEAPLSEAVISSIDWSQASRLGARFVVATGRGGALWFLPGELQSRLRSIDHRGLTLGAEQRLDLQETGFYRQESFQGAPGRWTNGAATLRLRLDPRAPPRTLEIETLAPGRDGTRLQILANGVELWYQRIPRAAWSRSFDLERVPLGDELLIELNSDTFAPAGARSGGGRGLGIVVMGIRLTSGEALDARDGPAAATGPAAGARLAG